MYGYGRRQMFLVELDYEAKATRSIFYEISKLYEAHRKMVITKREIKIGYF